MQKLDRTVGSSSNFYSQKKESEYYKKLSKQEIAEVFAYLNSVSYNYPLGKPPKMDKTIFSSRQH